MRVVQFSIEESEHLRLRAAAQNTGENLREFAARAIADAVAKTMGEAAPATQAPPTKRRKAS